jgi:hypothetical protein
MQKKLIVFFGLLVGIAAPVFSQISTDVGLTPAQDRWIFRSQYRTMGMENDMMEMEAQMIPVMLGYGLSNKVTVMARGVYMQRSTEPGGVDRSGPDDLFLLSKFRLFRKNTANYTLGIAPFVASNFPTGAQEISNRTWNPRAGLNISFRPRFMAVDLSASYVFYDVAGKLSEEAAGRFNLNMALSGMIPVGNTSKQVVAPVLEINYVSEGRAGSEKSEQWLFVSPGVTYRYSSLAVDLLYQQPVWGTELQGQMSQQPRWIEGLRYMF